MQLWWLTTGCVDETGCVDSFVLSFHSFICVFPPSFVHLIHSFIHSFIRSFIHSFIHSYVHSFIAFVPLPIYSFICRYDPCRYVPPVDARKTSCEVPREDNEIVWNLNATCGILKRSRWELFGISKTRVDRIALHASKFLVELVSYYSCYYCCSSQPSRTQPPRGCHT